MSDFPIEDCLKTASVLIAAGQEVYQKFTCENCGSRQTMETPNKFFTSGVCEECGHETAIEKCNYIALLGIR